MNKQGSILDLIGVLFVIMVIVIFGFIGLKVTKDFNEQILKMDNSTELQASTSAVENGYGILINLIPFIIFSLLLISIIFAYFVASHPIYFPFAVIMFMVLVLVTTLISNVLWQFINNPAIADVANDFPIVTTIIQNLAFIIAVFGAFILIALYAKPVGQTQFGFE